MSSRGTTVLPVPATHAGPRAPEGGLRWAGAILAFLGVVMLCLAAGEALAGAEIGGRGDDVLRGSADGNRLAGVGGADTLHGAAGDDALYGGGGKDEIYGGAGDDFIEAKDGGADRVGCGPGRDSVSVDAEDLISADCETVYAG